MRNRFSDAGCGERSEEKLLNRKVQIDYLGEESAVGHECWTSAPLVVV